MEGAGEGELVRRLGFHLRRYRREHELSQEAFARLLGYHRTYVGGIERGERNLTLKSVERIADALNVDPLELLSQPRRSSSGRRRGSAKRSG